MGAINMRGEPVETNVRPEDRHFIMVGLIEPLIPDFEEWLARRNAFLFRVPDTDGYTVGVTEAAMRGET